MDPATGETVGDDRKRKREETIEEGDKKVWQEKKKKEDIDSKKKIIPKKEDMDSKKKVIPKPLSPLPGVKVVYFHDPELSVFEHAKGHPFRPFRAKLAHSLLCSYDLYPNFMEPLHPRLVTRTDLGQFHSDAYLELLATAQRMVNKKFSWGLGRQDQKDEDPEVEAKVEEVFRRFNMSAREGTNCVFPGLLDYCRMYTTGSIGCAARLCSGDVNTAINWYGGMCHARNTSAHLGCFVNDTVLAILELLQGFQRVLYINLSGVHSDAVEQAFYTTNRVLSISFHVKPNTDDPDYPGTGDVADIGVDDGEGYTVNVPLEPGMDDVAFVPMFRSIVSKAKTIFQPEAVVLQCGGALLSGERLSQFNMTCKGYGESVRVVRDFGLPLLLLGGIGVGMANVARLWAYLTAVVLGLESSLPEQIPETLSEYREYFAPQYETCTRKAQVPENLFSPKTVPNLRRKIMNNLDKLRR